MNKSNTYRANRFILLVILSATISCDSLTENDSIKPEKQVTFTQSEYYVLPGSTIIIDLKSVIKGSFSDVTLSISKNPQKGTLSHVDTFRLKYRPGKDFKAGQDHFVLSAMSDGKLLATRTLRINMKKSKEEFPCALIAVEDKINIRPGSSVSIPILENDRLCDIDQSSLNISIHTQPNFGQAIVKDESIVYTPGPEYKHHDELIYQVTSATGESIFYGFVSIARSGEFTFQKIEGRTLTSLFFIDENTGFLGTDSGIYKTNDGGINWNVSGEGVYCSDIFFLNESKGFAVMEWDMIDRIVSTNDGGVNWKILTHFEKRVTGVVEKHVTGIVFTSETTGFIGVCDVYDRGKTSILKTEDGGVTWRKVFEDVTVWTYPYFDFINPNIGYAVFSERLFVTTDAGETWNLLVESSLGYFEVTSENKFFAVEWTEDGPTLFAPDNADAATLITSDNGSQWRVLADLSYTITSLGFSPAADVGFASLFLPAPSYEDPNLPPLSIVKTVDGGETWEEQNFDEALYGNPVGMSVPSSEVVYFLCRDKIIKVSYK